MRFHFVLAIVAWIALLCTAAPPSSDLSHRSIPFTGVSHPDLFNDATGKEDHRHTEISILKRDAVAGTEAATSPALCATTNCPTGFIGAFVNGVCECRFADSAVPPAMSSDPLHPAPTDHCPECPKGLFSFNDTGVCICDFADHKRRAVTDSLTEEPALTPDLKCPEDCPARTFPYYFDADGKEKCVCRPVLQEREIQVDVGWGQCNKDCPPDMFPAWPPVAEDPCICRPCPEDCPGNTRAFYYNLDGQKKCTCRDYDSPADGFSVWVPWAKCIANCTEPDGFHYGHGFAFIDSDAQLTCSTC